MSCLTRGRRRSFLTRGRRISAVSRAQYLAVKAGVDRLIELESMYLAQRDRIDAIIEKEQELGYPFEMTDRSMITGSQDSRRAREAGEGVAGPNGRWPLT